MQSLAITQLDAPRLFVVSGNNNSANCSYCRLNYGNKMASEIAEMPNHEFLLCNQAERNILAGIPHYSAIKLSNYGY